MTEYTPTTAEVRWAYAGLDQAAEEAFDRWLQQHDAEVRAGVVPEEPAAPKLVDARDPECVKVWPGCASMEYDPRCCRFPKSCSAGGWVPVEQTIMLG